MKNTTKTILKAGLIAGFFRWCRCHFAFKNEIQFIFQYIASGLFGKAAFESGTTMVIFGILIY
jgi:hypothetical protein